jgi:hypothetical protein
MALANTAWILASAGKRVLTIDWDLEAPGLHRYFQPFLTDKELSGQESQGVIDMAIDFAIRAATPAKKGEKVAENWYETHADFSKWRQQLRWPSGDAVELGRNGRGEIDFVSAGRQASDYAKRVNHFDWHSFYDKLGGGAFFDAAKRRFDLYDYVLIDSRTGVSDTSGICTVHMPDTLVLCFTLNYQSIKGASAVAQSVKEQRPQMRFFPLPTRIDGSEEKLLNRMKNYAANIFNPLLDPKIDVKEYWYSMEVPYLARYAYAEKLTLFEEQSSISASTLPAMERLCEYLTDGDVRVAGKLPEGERLKALAEFEGIEPAEVGSSRPAVELVVKSRVGVFLSYAAADRDIARALSQSLRNLGGDNIEVFLDIGSRSYAGGRDTITSSLEKSDFLLVLIGQSAPSLSHAGFEIGFFSSVKARERDEDRRIVYLYLDEPPTTDRGDFGIDLRISARDLSGSRQDYLQKVSQTAGSDDPMTDIFAEITGLAKRRFPSVKAASNRELIANEVISLRGILFDSMRGRVASEITWHGVMNFDLMPQEASSPSIPDDAIITGNRRAFEILDLSSPLEISWRDFREAASYQPSVISALDQLVAGAVSRSGDFETGRVVKLRDRTFRIEIMRRREYFDGRKAVQAYLIEILPTFGTISETSIALGIVTTAIKYKGLFERKSRVSNETFALTRNARRRQDLVRRLLGQLSSIEEDERNFGLNQSESLDVLGIFGHVGLDLFVMRQNEFSIAREKLMISTTQVLNMDSESSMFNDTYERFLVSLNTFRDASESFSDFIGVRALDNLSKAFTSTERR